MTSTIRGNIVLTLIGLAAGVALLQLPLAALFAAGEATGHARFHALFALGVLAVGAGLVVRWPTAGAVSRVPAIGLATLGVAQIVESFGAYGYDAANEARINGFAAVHDLGLALSALGLVAAGLGVAIGAVVAASRLTGAARAIGVVGAVAIGAAGLLFVKTMMG